MTESRDRTAELRQSAYSKAGQGAWLSAQEAAAVLGVDPKTVYDQAFRGEIKSRKVGSRRLIDPADVMPSSLPRMPEQQNAPAPSVNTELLLANIDHALTILHQAKAVLQEAQ